VLVLDTIIVGANQSGKTYAFIQLILCSENYIFIIARSRNGHTRM